jgi:hypothetical protein
MRNETEPDDSLGDAVWNTILRTRFNYKFDLDNLSLFATSALRTGASLNGNFQILDGPDHVVIDGPDQIATVVFQVPDTQETKWVADGELRDSDNQLAGRVQFSQVWSPRAELATLEKELQLQVIASEQKVADSTGTIAFWSVTGLLCLIWYCKSFTKNGAKQSAEEQK